MRRVFRVRQNNPEIGIMNHHAEHVMGGMGHALIVSDSLEQNRRQLRRCARTLERFTTCSAETRLIVRKCAELMRTVEQSLKVAEEANGDVCKCLGAIVESDLSERNERKGEPHGASEGENASPNSVRATPATTSAPTSL